VTVPFAAGDPRPAWPLPATAPSVDVRDSREFGAPRRHGQRVHVGLDLGSTQGEPVIATEAGRVVAIQGPTWAGETPSAAVLIETDTGIVVALCEVEPSTVRVAKGDRVAKGQRIGEVGPTRMLHLETYRAGTRSTAQWWAGSPPPAELLDPTAYVQAAATAAGQPLADLPSWTAIRDAVASKAASFWPWTPSEPTFEPMPAPAPAPAAADGGGAGVGLLVVLALVAWGAR
jgi:murein DD-endopeptidase MepM/ murein hydrolase activator NlpD